MVRARVRGGIAFAGLGLALLMGQSHGLSQSRGANTPAATTMPTPAGRAAAPAAPAQNVADVRAETQATLEKYCTTCHNARLKTAGLTLDPAASAHPGDQSETWEKVLRQLRGGTMPPPGAARPPQTFYTRAATYLARELEASAAAHPNPGSLPLAHRLTRTEYANVIRDLLALPDLPKELEYT